jgi:hypothetical protein
LCPPVLFSFAGSQFLISLVSTMTLLPQLIGQKAGEVAASSAFAFIAELRRMSISYHCVVSTIAVGDEPAPTSVAFSW